MARLAMLNRQFLLSIASPSRVQVPQDMASLVRGGASNDLPDG
ncbi:MAG: hypothetical protein ACYYK0_06620 [Candidatus Eutrophobiaceae bacterium]